MHAFHPSSDFAAHFGNFSPNPGPRDWSTTTKIVSPHDCIQHIEAMHLCPKLDAKTRMILFFYFGQNNTIVLLLAPISILLKSIRQPSQFVNPAQGWRVDEFELVNPQNTGSRIYINEINSTTRQPDNPSTRTRIARHFSEWIFFCKWGIIFYKHANIILAQQI